jgi:hypothetical protein
MKTAGKPAKASLITEALINGGQPVNPIPVPAQREPRLDWLKFQ